MGMVMHLGTALVLEAARGDPDLQPATDPLSRVHVLPRLGTRLHARLPRPAQERGHRLQVARRRLTPDCAQGAFHDYWISLGGGDDTTRPEGGHRSTIGLRRLRVSAPVLVPVLLGARAIRHGLRPARRAAALQGVAGMQRAGCIGGASLLLARYRDPVDHARVCGRLSGSRRPELPARRQRPGPHRRPLRAAPSAAGVHGAAAVDQERLLRVVRTHAERRHERPLRALGLPAGSASPRRAQRASPARASSASHSAPSRREARLASPVNATNRREGEASLAPRSIRSCLDRGRGRAGSCPGGSGRSERARAPAATTS